MLKAPASSSRFVIASLVTLEHPELAFIGCKPRQPGPTNWIVTTERKEAYEWTHADVAREFMLQLRDGEAYGLVNDGHLWHVVPA